MNRVLENIKKVTEIVLESIGKTKDKIKERNERRIAYDHYRTKLEDMEKPGKEKFS